MRDFKKEIIELTKTTRMYGKSINKDKDLLSWINNKYPYNCSLYLKVYMVVNNMTEPPKCPICGEYILHGHFTQGFKSYCGGSCANKDPKKQEKIRATCEKRYGKGITNPSQV